MNKEYIEEVSGFDKLKKLSVYMHYYVTQMGMKLNSEIVNIADPNYKTGRGLPDETFLGIGFYKLWKNCHVLSFEEFIKMPDITDHGEKWKEAGFAERYTVNSTGIYNWYWKFKNEIYD